MLFCIVSIKNIFVCAADSDGAKRVGDTYKIDTSVCIDSFKNG